MKRFAWIFILPLFFSCKKNDDPAALRLMHTESTDDAGDVYYTEYSYDNQGRITSISQHKNNSQPYNSVSITYSGNEVVLLSNPGYDPLYIINTEVRLMLDAEGKTMKRIEYTRRVADLPIPNPAEEFMYDTLVYMYDAGGLLTQTNRNRRDSSWIEAGYTIIKKFTSVATYTNNGGNLVASDEYVTYPFTTTQNGVTTISGGSSEYHAVFSYNKSYPNETDFKNEAVLNEYNLYYERPINNHYKNMPDHVDRSSTDRDINGGVIFNGSTSIDIERSYDGKGLLSSVNIPTSNTPYNVILYFYGK